MKAVIDANNGNELVTKGDRILIEGHVEGKAVEYPAMLIIDGDKTTVGSPTVAGAVVKGKVLNHVRADKVTSIRYKSKKRVHKKRGHRQHQSLVEITSIDTK